MYYTIYKITNQINGKFYIGSHKTNDLNDDYMGSGKYLIHAQKKHGLDKFIKEILFVYDNPEEMYAKEAEIVNDEFLAEENTYNLKRGGYGGWDYNNTPEGQKLREHTYVNWIQAGTSAFQKAYSEDIEFKLRRLEHLQRISAMATVAIAEKYPNGVFHGKKHSVETKHTMSNKAKERLKDPTNNSQYGTVWITNGLANAKIDKNESIPDGWKRGRIMKVKS